MPEFNLYDYQEKAVHHAVQMLSERANSLIVAGTGAGKTIMLASVIGRFFYGFQAANGRKPHVLVLVHRTEIHGQNYRKFSLVCPEIPSGEITAQRKSMHGYVHFGMVQTIAGILPELERAGSFFDLIVVDECHHSAASTYENIIDWNKQGKPNAGLFGVTATPNRGDKLPLIHLFDNFYQITTRFLIDSHYLVRPTFVDCSPRFSIRGKDGKITEETGHLSKNCKMDMDGKELISRLCDDYLAHKADGKSVIFAPSHALCEVIYSELSKRGHTPSYLSAGLDDGLRQDEIARFENGNAEELINVDIATEGYDYPPIRNVVDFDTNGTHGQWVQKVGRGLRACEGKIGCTVIDFGGNIALYPQGVDADVNLEGGVKKAKGEKLSESDLFATEKECTDKRTAMYENPDIEIYTPYSPPKGIETVSDKAFGIVFVACGQKNDCIIVPCKDGDTYSLYLGDKEDVSLAQRGTFDLCAKAGLDWCGYIAADETRAISRLQTRLLAPEFAASALTWYGANCCICWKTWRDVIGRMHKCKADY